MSVKTISKLYGGLQQARQVDTLYIKSRWEREGNLSLTVEEWESICESQWKTTHSLFWREFAWKGVSRFFSTPAQIKQQSPNCWRSCGFDKANHFHIFWSCPSINQYWYEIHTCLEIIFKIQIPFRFEVMYLGLISSAFPNKYLFRILTIASKKAITRKWLQPTLPTLEDWKNIVHDIFTMEKLTYALRLKSQLFSVLWRDWIDYITHIQPDLG